MVILATSGCQKGINLMKYNNKMSLTVILRGHPTFYDKRFSRYEEILN